MDSKTEVRDGPITMEELRLGMKGLLFDSGWRWAMLIYDPQDSRRVQTLSNVSLKTLRALLQKTLNGLPPEGGE